MKIKGIKSREVFDSRGESTLEVEVFDGEGNSSLAQIPRGKSTGTREVSVFSADKIGSILTELVLPKIVDKNFSSVQQLDDFLLNLDGTRTKSRLGGNLTLGISIGFLKLLAGREKKPLWQTLQDNFFSDARKAQSLPRIFANFINGGAHANNNLAFQEYLVIAEVKQSLTQTIKRLLKLYTNTKDLIREEQGLKNIPLGDEAGICVDFKDNLEPLARLEDLIKKNHLEQEFVLGVDAAASNFFKDGYYVIDERKLESGELLNYYSDIFQKHKLLLSIEDPFWEKDFGDFRDLHESLPAERLVVGDDLTVSNPELINKAFTKNSLSGIIIKPNQIGTVTETCIAIKVSQQHNFKIIISHRSGETEDNFIIHLARAVGAFGVKIGPPARERIIKYNEMLRLYE